ncbi:FtsX-like permease family protein [Dickeya dianthicola]|uniref:ABC transporter permease n=1 Tax=Dickeya dianthicola TaxID=204039 RepID=UPI00136E53FE|nr:ABC transporter permease [Dickeya dianthicola]MCI4255087.1 ABC transporter permease [Dickeya dianthicola]MZG21194.1 FtsX-like permease family protein [Dickeya dianthicola]MZI88618.1 FtsX-like permease family protein [Dickeya dianthicola]
MNVWFDIRYALRLLLKSPGFSVLTITVMACGLGLALYMYSVINTIMYKTLPYPKGEDMVMVTPNVGGVSLDDSGLNFLDYTELSRQSTKLDDIGYFYAEFLDLNDGNRSVKYIGILSTPHMFSYTGTSPLMGRVLNDKDMQPDALPVTVISYDLWKSYFNGREDILKQSVQINGIRTYIVGVMPKGFAFPFFHDIWLPSKIKPLAFSLRSQAPDVYVYAHLNPHFSLDEANQEIVSVMDKLADKYPESNKGVSAVALSFQVSFMGDDTAQVFLITLSAVAFVLLLACCNVGNLLLARSHQRAREIAIRAALGSPMMRLVMQMLWESLIICILAGIVGVLLAAWGLDLTNKIFPRFVPTRVPSWWHLSLDSSMIVNASILVIVTAFITGALPAWKIANGQFFQALKDGTRGITRYRTSKAGRSLVIVEMALSFSILCISILFLILVTKAKNVDYGVATDGYLISRVNLNKDSYSTEQSRRSFYLALSKQLHDIPNLTSEALTTSAPGEFTEAHQFLIENREDGVIGDEGYPMANDVGVMPGSLTGMGVNVLYGREFSAQDNEKSLPVAVISESLARKYWPDGKSAIGKRIRFRSEDNTDWYTVIGVVSHVIHGRPFSAFKNRATVYRSLLQRPAPMVTIMLKSEHLVVLPEILKLALYNVDNLMPVGPPQALNDMIERNTFGVSVLANLFMLFGVITIVLSSSGIYAVTQNAISQRIQEIGIRQVLGATPNHLLRMLMLQGVNQLIAGLILGLPLALLAAPRINRILGDGRIHFTLLFACVALFIVIIVALATWIPSRRVIMMKPGDAIRYE